MYVYDATPNNIRKMVIMNALDRIDYEIIRLLRNNARLSNKELAEQVGLAPSTCLVRTRLLQQSGVITGFKAEGSQPFWRIEGGVLIGENDAAKKGHYLWTEKEYRDFVIEFDVRWKTTTPRGVDTVLAFASTAVASAWTKRMPLLAASLS